LLYLSLYLKENRSRYYELLDAVRREGNWEAWLAFFLEGVRTTAEEAVAAARTLTATFAEDRERIASAGRRAASALRVHDVLKMMRYVKTDEHKAKLVHLFGLGKNAGPLAAAARAQASDAIDKAAIDADGFRFESLERVTDPMFLPGAVKYGDVPALLALGAPGKVWTVGDDAELKPVKAAYAAAGKADQLTITPKAGDADRAVEWLRQP
jgi:hypothetical protein